MIILIAFSCSSPSHEEPPEREQFNFSAEKQTLNAYEKGREYLKSEDFKDAIDAFENAISISPDSVNLKEWLAYALLKDKQLQRSLELLDLILDNHPGSGDARYNRAAVNTALHRYKEAASDLQILYANKHAHPLLVGEDNDFLALRTIPEFQHLVPTSFLDVYLASSPVNVLVGEQMSIEWQIRHRDDLSVSTTNVSELIDLYRVTEIRSKQDEVLFLTTLKFDWIGLRGGQTNVLDLAFRSGAATTTSESFSIQVTKINERKVPDGKVDLLIPSRWVGDKQIPWVGRLPNGWGLVVAPPNSHIQMIAEHQQSWIYMEGDDKKWVAKMTTEPTPVLVKIMAGSEVILETNIPELQ